MSVCRRREVERTKATRGRVDRLGDNVPVARYAEEEAKDWEHVGVLGKEGVDNRGGKGTEAGDGV